MKRVKLQTFDIKFINHASLFISDEKNKFLTDPWYISPAFGGWVQNPFPIYNDVEEIINEYPGIDPARSTTITPGALIARELMEIYEIKNLVVSENDILEGLILNKVLN